MDIDEINEHIRKLKCEGTSWQSVEKLAALCAVRDELEEKQPDPAPAKEAPPEPAYSTASAPRSEFVEAASSVPFGGLIDVLDQHMSAIRMVYPKEYDLVIRKIKAL